MIVVAVAAIIGACVGSFANVCALRWPRDESVLAPRSACGGCGRGLRWYELLPGISWIVLGGRCRSCGIFISVQYPLMELGTALLWAGTASVHGLTYETVRGALFLTILLTIAASDARFFIIPDQLSLGGAVLGVMLALLPGGIGVGEAALGALVGFATLWSVGWVATVLLRRLAPERLEATGYGHALGDGDIKMMLVLGAFLGPGGVAVTVLAGSVLALLVFGPLSLRSGRLIPFGVFLGVGGAVAYTWGSELVSWYLSQFG